MTPQAYNERSAAATEAAKREQLMLEREFDRAAERRIRYIVQQLPVSVDLDDLYGQRVPQPVDLDDLYKRQVSRRVATTMAPWDDDDRAKRSKRTTARVDSVAAYLRDAGRAKLLSHEEEIAIAKRIEAGGKDGDRARDEMIRANLRLVISVAKKYNGKGLPQLDLIQAGNIGLIRAVDKFDYHRGYRLSTMATPWIKDGITQAFKKEAEAHFLGQPVDTDRPQRRVAALTGPTQAPIASPEEWHEDERRERVSRDMEELGAYDDYDAAFAQQLRPIGSA